MSKQDLLNSPALEHHWQDLANAIILNAVAEYRKLWRKKRSGQELDCIEQSAYDNCEWFFLSPDFATLTTIDGFELMTQLQDETEYIRTGYVLP